MSYAFYKVLHLSGLFLVLFSLGGLILHSLNGGTKATNQHRKILMMSHGIGLTISFIAGFGLLARIGMHNFTTWVVLKICIWLYFCIVTLFLYKSQKLSKILWWKSIFLFVIAAYLAAYKPF